MHSAGVIIFAIVMVLGSPILALVTQAPPVVGEIVLVIAPPLGTPIGHILAQSNLQDIYPARAPICAFVHLDSNESYDRLLKNGAWLVMSGERILALC